MTLIVSRTIAAGLAAIGLLVAGCTDSNTLASDKTLVADETPRSIACESVSLKEGSWRYRRSLNVPQLDSPLGVTSATLLTNTPEKVEFEIELKGDVTPYSRPTTPNAVNPDTVVSLEMAFDSSESPNPTPFEEDYDLPEPSENKYQMIFWLGDDSVLADLFENGNSVNSATKSDVSWTLDGTDLRLSFDPSNFPKLQAGKNFGYSVFLVHKAAANDFTPQICNDTVEP